MLSEDAVKMMRGWQRWGSFSLNTEVWVTSWERAGLERTLLYRARPVFAGERLAWLEPDQRLIYHLPKARSDGQTYLAPWNF